MFVQALRDVARFYGRSWWFVALVQLGSGLLVAVPVFVLAQAATAYVSARGAELASADQLGPVVAVLLIIAVVVCLPLALVGVSATVRTVNDSLAGRNRRFLAAFAEGFRHVPALAAAASGTILGIVALAVLSPLLTVLGLIALLLTPVVRLVRRRREGFAPRWPDLVLLAWVIAPLGLAVRFAAGAMLFAPAVVLHGLGPIAALRAGAEAARPRRLRLVGVIIAGTLVSVALQTGAAWLGSFLAPAGSLAGQVLMQLFLVALPVVLVTVLFVLSRATGADGLPPASRTAPYASARALAPRRIRQVASVPGVVRRVAIVMPFVVVIAGIGLAPSAASAAPAELTLTVTSDADTTDATALAAQSASCLSGGDCTLRAAVLAAATASDSGSYNSIVIGFDGSHTIAVTPGSPIAFVGAAGSSEGGGEGGEGGEGGAPGTLTIDGSGSTVVLDGQGASQIMLFHHNSWGLNLIGLQLSNGVGADELGGALDLTSPRQSVIDSVTFSGNTAGSAGGAVITSGGSLTVVNSTFSGNSTGSTNVLGYNGGADIFALYDTSVVIANSTFADFTHGSLFAWSATGTSMSVSNSVFDVGSGFAFTTCDGGGFSGASNVVTGADTSCPDTIPNSVPAVGALTSLPSGGPAVRPLLPTAGNAAIGSAGSHGVECAAVDQRGMARATTTCDAGAVALNPATTTALSSSLASPVFGSDVTFTATVALDDGGSTVGDGSVAFVIDGDGTLPAVAVGAGSASLTLGTLSAGTHTVVATYIPVDPLRIAGSQSATLNQEVAKSGSTVTLTSSANPGRSGGTVEVTATVTAQDPSVIPTGSVTLRDATSGTPGTVVGTAGTLDGSGVATFDVAGLAPGRHALVAEYSGDDNNLGAASATLSQVIQVASTLHARVSDDTSEFGEGIAVTVTVPASGSLPTPTGAVTVTWRGIDHVVTLDGAGSATVVADDLILGASEITSSYSGDDRYAPSTGAAIPVTITAAATSTALAVDDATLAYGVPNPLTATVSRAAGSAPAGSVTFFSGSTELQTVALAAGTGPSATASYTPTPGQLPVGSPSLTAVYTPGYGYTASTSGATTVTVRKATATVTVGSGTPSAAVGTPVTLTATLAGAGGSVAVPDGDVEFFAGSTSLGTATASGGVASLSHTFTASGSRSITASYAGSASFAAALSDPFVQPVASEGTVTTLTVSPGSSTFGTTLRLDVDVVRATNGLPATGSVVVRDGTTVVATIPLVGGSGFRTITGVSAASHSYQATFVPADSDFAASTSAVVIHTVGAAATSTALTFSSASSVHGDTVTLTATVTSADAAPAGTVTFTTGDLTLGTVAVVASTGTASVATLEAALPQSADYPNSARDVVAAFTPSADFSGSSSTVAYAVARGTTSMSVALVGTTAGAAQSLVATVSTLTGTGSPVGTVTFAGGSGASGTVPIMNGVATLAGVTLPAGSRSVLATYTSVDRDFEAPTVNPVSTTAVVTQGTPTVTLGSSSAGPVGYGAPVTLTATVAGGTLAPTGTVRFTATSAAGSRDLGSASVGSGSAVLVSRDIPVGTQSITAAYLGDNNFITVTSAALSLVVTQTATTTVLTVPQGASQPGETITLRAAVTSPGATVGSGSVQFLLGGTELGTAVVTAGVSTYTYTPGTAGALAFEATYTSASGDFGASSGTLTHTVDGRGVTLLLRAPSTSANVGDPITLNVSLIMAPGVTGAPTTLPTGRVTVGDGIGPSCTTDLTVNIRTGILEGSCQLTYASAGLRTLTATYAGDSLYAAATSDPVVVLAYVRDTSVRLTGPASWIAGQPVTVNWAVTGPPAGGSVTIRDGSTVLCTSTALSGTCTTTFARDRAEATFTLTYTGNAEWSGKSANLTQAIITCVLPATSDSSPSDGGTVTLTSTPNCGSDGFLPGSYVDFRATPAPGFTFEHWRGGTDNLPITQVLAVAGGRVFTTAYFQRECVSVTFTAVGGTRGAPEITSSVQPNCGGGWTGSDYRSRTGMFQVGTAIDLKAAPVVTASQAPRSFYEWLDLSGDPRLAPTRTYTVTGELDQDVTATFGATCVHDVRVTQPAGATVSIDGANCRDGIGDGYALGSVIQLSTKTTGTAYFTGWSTSVAPLTATSTGGTGRVTIRTTNPVITANYSDCVSFSVGVSGNTFLSGGDNYINGKASVTPTGNCPNRGAGWYVPGTKVSIDTTGERGKTFGGWSTALPLQAMAKTAKNYVTVNASGTATALWYAENQCKPYTVRAVQPEYVTVSSTLNGGDQGCPAGQLNSAMLGTSGQQITLTATATQGAPLLGWSGVTTRWADSSLTTQQQVTPSTLNPRTVGIASTGSFTAWACQAISTTLTLISPNGTKNSEPLPSGTDFVGASPAPDCPITASAYTLGQDVFPQALEATSGYTFLGWSGAIDSTDAYPTTPITIDGASRYIDLTATYQVNCFTLTTNPQHTRIETTPNCPDTDVTENKFIGGTVITLQTIGNAGTKVFRGFTGDMDGQSGIYSWVTINKDSAIYSNYETRSVGEAITDAVSDFGNGTAILAKKAVGVVAAAAAAFVMGDNPVLMLASLVVLLGTGVQAVADALNLSSDGLKNFTGGITALSQMLTFMQAGATCATVWSASTGTIKAADVNTSALGAAGVVVANRIIEIKDKAAAVREAQRAAQSAAMAAAYDARLANQLLSTSDDALSLTTRAGNYVSSTVKTATDKVTKALDSVKGPLETVGRLGDVALVGYTIYNEYTNENTGWDSSAESAWTTGGDVYMNCLMDAVPPYFGVPPRTK